MMEGNLFIKNKFTAEYRFAKDLVMAVFEMRTIYVPSFSLLQQDNTSLAVEQKAKVKELFAKEWPRLEKLVKRFTSGSGGSNYGDRQFLFCVIQLREEYKPELKSEEEFLLVCARIAYVASCFLRKNEQSDAISVAVDRVYEILIDTFYPALNENGPIIKDIRDGKYRFAYDFIKVLVGMRGITVPDLELPNEEHLLLKSDDKHKVKELLDNERLILDERLRSFTRGDGKFDYSDDNLLRFMGIIVEDNGLLKITKDEFLFLCARIAYAATWFRKENSKSNSFDLAVEFIQQMVKKTVHFNIYNHDNDYRFSCDLVKIIAEMRNNSFSFAEMSHSSSSFFMIAHRNKIEDLLSRERLHLEKTVMKFVNKGKTSDYNDNQFEMCMDYIIHDCIPVYKLKEELVHACAKIAYVSAYFLRKNEESNASRLALNRMLEIVKDIDSLPNSTDKDVLIMRRQDDHFRFAYDLVKTILEMKCVPAKDIDLPDPDNFLFKKIHRRKIEELFTKESSELDKVVGKFTNMYGIFDYSDKTFLQCMHEIMKKYQYDRKTEEGLVFISAAIGYLSACFCKNNWKSNAPFLAVNRIYEMIKDFNCFSNSREERVLIVKAHDDHYRFAYDLTKMVFEVKGIPVSPVDLPAYENLLFTGTCKKQIQDQLSKDWFQLNEMVEKLTKDTGYLDYSDNKFVHCMNQIIEDYQSDQETEFVYLCARIAYTAAVFLEKNCRSNSTFLAVNRMYEMSKDVFCNKMDEAIIKDDYHFAYDLVHAVLRLRNNSSFKIEMPYPDISPLIIKHRNEMQNFLSKEWPRLHQLVRRFTKTCTAFSDSHFLHCLHQIMYDNAPEQKSEKGLLLLSTRIAYVAICFVKKNQNSNAAHLAVDHIYQMKKKFCKHSDSRGANILIQDASDDIFRFAIDLVRTVMELQDAPFPDKELPNPGKTLFTSQNRKTVKKLIEKESTKIDKLVEKITNRHGNLDCSDGTFQRLMDQIIKDNKREQENKNGFVRLFARIAYPVSYFSAKNDESNSLKLAIQRIHEIARNLVHFNKDLEGRELTNDIIEEYSFAYDLAKTVTTVTLIDDQELPHVILSDQENCPMTAEDKRKIDNLFSEEGPELDDIMERSKCKDRNVVHSDEFFVKCMDDILKKYKYTPDCYTTDGIIAICGKITYVVSCYFRKMSRSKATQLAAKQLYTMLKECHGAIQ